MGQKRTQNTIDKAIGEYLIKFEKHLIGTIDRRLTDRLDTLQKTEKDLKKTVQRSTRAARRTEEAVVDFELKIYLNILAVTFAGGMLGGLFMFLMVWYVW
jgi:hypothetical protein